jgi:excisionase family DNA binding protein
MLRDNDFGVVRVRAFGTYDFKIVDAKTFLREVAGSDHNFRLDEFSDTMRSRIVSIFTDALASTKVPVLDVAARYTELGEALLPLINPAVQSKYGLEITSFIVENVSVPPEVEQAVDKRSSMAAIGNLNDFVKYQMGKGFEAGGGAAGAAGTAAELAVGFGLAQQMMKDGFAGGAATPTAGPALPELLSAAEAAQALGVSEADVLTVLESGELKGRKIGATWRIPRAALASYMAP